MSALNLLAIKKSLDQRTDEQLVNALSFSQDDYDSEVVPLIKELLIERGFTIDQIEIYDNSYKSLKTNLKQNKSNYKADFWSRAIAFIIDIVILRLLWYIWFDILPPNSENAMYGTSLLISLIYFVLTEGLLSRTIGMAIIGLRVISVNSGKNIGMPFAISRTLGRLICQITLGIGYLAMLVNKNKQALHDKYSQTYVVYK